MFEFLKRKRYISGTDFGIISRLFGQQWEDSHYLEAYGKSLYVYAAVSKIAEKISSAELKLHKILNSQGDYEEVHEHPALDLINKTNPFFTKEEFFMTDTINRKLAGDSFMLKVRNNSKDVVELWNIRPDLVEIYPSPENYISHYIINSEDGRKTRIETEDMIHIKYPSPLEMYFGMSPLSSASTRVDTERYASEYQRDFFLNNARPDAIIEMPEGVTKQQADELRQGWEKKHQGQGKNSKIGILGGGAKYQQISLSQREMDYIESMKATRDDILVAFKVPKPIVAISDSTGRSRAETEALQEIFLNECIVPELRLLVGKLNEELIAPDFGEEYFLTFTDPVPVNREMRLQEFQAGVDKWITVNEIRGELGLEPIEGGDTLYKTLAQIPMGTDRPVREDRVSLNGKRGLRMKMQIKEEFNKEFKEAIQKKASASLFADSKRRKQYWEYRTKDIDRKSEQMRRLVNNITDEQRDEFLKEFNKKKPKSKSEIRELFNRKEQNIKFRDAIFPLMVSLFKEAGQDAMSLVSFDKPFTIEKSIGPQIKKLLTARAMFFANTVNETTLLGLTDTLSEGIAAGEGIVKLRNRVKNEYEDFSNYRSIRIARTETTAVVNQAHIEAYEQSGVVRGKEWISTMDSVTREEHLLMDGEVVGLKEVFSNGLEYPSECNCRCTLGPVTWLPEL